MALAHLGFYSLEEAHPLIADIVLKHSCNGKPPTTRAPFDVKLAWFSVQVISPNTPNTNDNEYVSDSEEAPFDPESREYIFSPRGILQLP